jgi:WD40 repeat protein
MSAFSRMCAAVVPLLILAVAAAAPVPPLKPPQPITPANAEQVRKISEIQRYVWRIVWGPGAQRVSFQRWHTGVEIFDSKTLKPLNKIATDKKLVDFACADDGHIAAWSENGTKVEVRDLRTNKSFELEAGNSGPRVAFAPDGKQIATGGYGTHVNLWDVATGKLVQTLDAGLLVGALTPVFSPNGQLLAIGHRNSDTRIYEVATGKLLHVLGRKMSHELKFSPDGRVLAVAYVDGGIGLWDMTDGSLIRDCASGAKDLYSLDWSPDGNVLASGGRGGKITLWDPRTLKPLKELDAPEWVIQVRFSPDGARLFTAGGTDQPSPDRKVTVWGVP